MLEFASTITLCVSLVCPIAADQDGARALVEKAIKAHGGPANVAKLRTMRIKVVGTAVLAPGQAAVPFTIEDTWQMPDRYKSESTFQFMGQTLTQTQVINGGTGWLRMNGQVQDMPKESLSEMKEQKYGEDFDRLAFLDQKGLTLAELDEIKVDGKPAVGVVVKSAGHREVKLYFDKATGLLVKRVHAVLDPGSGKETQQEVIFGDYQVKDGVKHYRKITGLRDGRKVFDGKVSDLEFFEKLDVKVFAKP